VLLVVAIVLFLVGLISRAAAGRLDSMLLSPDARSWRGKWLGCQTVHARRVLSG
jgi:hypothetical protein